MSFKFSNNGPNFAPAYETSGIPYVTSSTPTQITSPDNSGGLKAGALATKISFPFVTKWFTVKNIGANGLRVGFSEAGVLKKNEYLSDGTLKSTDEINYFVISPSGSNGHRIANGATIIPTELTLNVRCKDLFLAGDEPRANPGTNHATGYTLMAGLTTIERDQFPTLTGSINGEVQFKGVG